MGRHAVARIAVVVAVLIVNFGGMTPALASSTTALAQARVVHAGALWMSPPQPRSPDRSFAHLRMAPHSAYATIVNGSARTGNAGRQGEVELPLHAGTEIVLIYQ